MKELVKCKPCGYIMEKSKLGDTCPACGVPSKVFEDYKDRMSPKRRKLLDLDLHPIAVHFPQTVAVFILQFVLLNLFFPNFKNQEITSFVLFLSVLLPFSVFGAFVSGIIDGKLRFKKLKTTALIRKIIIGSAMIITSSVVAYASIVYEYNQTTKIIILTATLISLLLAISLAVTGKKLMYAEMPG